MCAELGDSLCYAHIKCLQTCTSAPLNSSKSSDISVEDRALKHRAVSRTFRFRLPLRRYLSHSNEHECKIQYRFDGDASGVLF